MSAGKITPPAGWGTSSDSESRIYQGPVQELAAQTVNVSVDLSFDAVDGFLTTVVVESTDERATQIRESLSALSIEEFRAVLAAGFRILIAYDQLPDASPENSEAAL